MLVPLLALLQLAPATAPQSATPVVRTPATATVIYSGVDGDVDVAVPRLELDIEVDGVLDESAWADASVLTGFSQYRPVDGLAAEDNTEILVWYSGGSEPATRILRSMTASAAARARRPDSSASDSPSVAKRASPI